MAKNKLYNIRVRVAELDITMNDVIAALREGGMDVRQSRFSKALNRDAAELTDKDYEILERADKFLATLEAKGA